MVQNNKPSFEERLTSVGEELLALPQQGLPNITREQFARFFGVLAICGNVSEACRRAKISRVIAYRYKKRSKAFSDAWDEAARVGLLCLEDEARRRAFQGWDKPVFYQGEQVAVTQEYSDTLLMFLLNGGMSEKYKHRQVTEHAGSVTLNRGIDLTRLDEEELRLLRTLADKAGFAAE